MYSKMLLSAFGFRFPTFLGSTQSFHVILELLQSVRKVIFQHVILISFDDVN